MRKVAFVLLIGLWAGSALAQAWPARPVRFVVPFPPGAPPTSPRAPQ